MSLFAQPKAVYAVAFACVISFMGIGLVDPILPSLRTQLKASPSQVTLLFTSYLVVTAFAMLLTNWVSSRLGTKRTLVTGLAIIVVFSALAGTSDSINGIVGFRAGWGLGNALFIATSLAVIVASATGGLGGAIVLYEAALGLGIAVGPLLGGTLGNISWRGPFFGVAALMAVALIAIVVLPDPVLLPTHHTSLSAPLKALSHRGLLTLSITALLYNWGFFTMLGYAPFPMGLSAIQLGFVFFGWGLLVAFFSVFGAPRLQRRYGTARSLYAALLFFAVDLAVISIFVNNRTVLVVAEITAGIFIGINNTLTTQAVMMVSPRRAAGRLRRLRLRPLPRRRTGAVRRRQARRTLQPACAVCHRRSCCCCGSHRVVHGTPDAGPSRPRSGRGRSSGHRARRPDRRLRRDSRRARRSRGRYRQHRGGTPARNHPRLSRQGANDDGNRRVQSGGHLPMRVGSVADVVGRPRDRPPRPQQWVVHVTAADPRI